MSGAGRPADDLPVFSPRLDEVMAAMVKGEAPNAGRFCGYCYTPMSKTAESCRHCGRPAAGTPPVAHLPGEFIAMYRRMRKRESLVVNSFAFAGLALGVLVFTVIVALAVYVYDQSLLVLAVAVVVLLVGGRVFAGLLGGWIGDNVGYSYARRKLALEWEEYDRTRREAQAPVAEPGAAPSAATAANSR
jgi:hypothetical protein